MITPLSSRTLTQDATLSTSQPSAASLERFATAMNATVPADAEAMKEFHKRFNDQLLKQMIRDSQKLTSKLTGKA